MRTNATHEIRALLRANEDGMTLEDICTAVSREKKNVRHLLKNMPDTYIDRWEPAPRLKWRAIWCAVSVPPDCPMPEKQNDPHR